MHSEATHGTIIKTNESLPPPNNNNNNNNSSSTSKKIIQILFFQNPTNGNQKRIFPRIAPIHSAC
jgi:hypothetical protein